MILIRKLICFVILLLLSCVQSKTKYEKKFILNSQERCFYYKKQNGDTLHFNRNVEILENTINDTVILGDQILLPKQTGKIKYTEHNGNSLQLEYQNPPAIRICLYFYNNRAASGFIKIRFQESSLYKNR